MDLPIPPLLPTRPCIDQAWNARQGKHGGDSQSVTSHAEDESRESYRGIPGAQGREEDGSFGADGWEAEEVSGSYVSVSDCRDSECPE